MLAVDLNRLKFKNICGYPQAFTICVMNVSRVDELRIFGIRGQRSEEKRVLMVKKWETVDRRPGGDYRIFRTDLVR
ncbi:MAG: hypothetical protein ACKOB6_07310, partial [Candidatus Kapaibacterium sp.]